MDEMTCIQAAKKGDLEAFNALVLRYQDAIYRQASYLLGDPQDAEDATQDTFLIAYRKLDSFRGTTLQAWLFQICKNRCFDELRSRKRRRQMPFEPEDDQGETQEDLIWQKDAAPSPEEMVERAELEHCLQKHLDLLPDEMREMVILVDLLGLDYAESAQIAQTPIGTVKSRLARARERLRKSLQLAPERPAALPSSCAPNASARIPAWR